ncbi:hypothetical protein CANINC_000931 [Pichia inconspicua]|uniref:Peroxisomal membrane protein PEX11 n=1 Tax=Pichia inconspicua TaxID=52247 RepID=A0A4T0X532_9ASCO|nr:hypothetical protein CANINC_000931 [[Candida] inconspicua]
MTLELLVQHPVYKHILKFTANVETREKLLRLLQYFVRFLRYYKFSSALNPNFAKLLPSLQATFTMARKPLRCLKPLNHLNAFSICVNDELSDPVLRYTEAIKQFGLFFFFSFDGIQWLKLMGLLGGRGYNDHLLKSKFVRNVGKYAAGMWCLALIGGIIKNLRQFQIYIYRYLDSKSIDDNEDVEYKAPLLSLEKIKREFVKNVLDFVIALNLYQDLGINDGIVGGFGVMTSLITLQDLWNSNK